MLKEETVLWRWAKKPTTCFMPEDNWIIRELGRNIKSHNKAVYAGLNPEDWKPYKGNMYLHRIILTKEQAKQCVVAEMQPNIPDNIDELYPTIIGSYRGYLNDTYEDSFIPLIEYKGDYNLPEALIPFSVHAEICTH